MHIRAVALAAVCASLLLSGCASGTKFSEMGATMPAARKAQHLLTTVTCEHKTDYQSHNTVNGIRKSIKRIHSRSR